MKYILLNSIFILLFASCSQGQTNINNSGKTKAEVEKSEMEWKEILTPQEFQILRKKSTERAFTGEYNKHYENGTYYCKGCHNPLFLSETKFDSGSGWPSYFDFIKGNVIKIQDKSHGMNRVEVVCEKCKGHLGHVFNDGPKPTGLRYCINSASLQFEEK